MRGCDLVALVVLSAVLVRAADPGTRLSPQPSPRSASPGKSPSPPTSPRSIVGGSPLTLAARPSTDTGPSGTTTTGTTATTTTTTTTTTTSGGVKGDSSHCEERKTCDECIVDACKWCHDLNAPNVGGCTPADTEGVAARGGHTATCPSNFRINGALRLQCYDNCAHFVGGCALVPRRWWRLGGAVDVVAQSFGVEAEVPARYYRVETTDSKIKLKKGMMIKEFGGGLVRVEVEWKSPGEDGLERWGIEVVTKPIDLTSAGKSAMVTALTALQEWCSLVVKGEVGDNPARTAVAGLGLPAGIDIVRYGQINKVASIFRNLPMTGQLTAAVPLSKVIDIFTKPAIIAELIPMGTPFKRVVTALDLPATKRARAALPAALRGFMVLLGYYIAAFTSKPHTYYVAHDAKDDVLDLLVRTKFHYTFAEVGGSKHVADIRAFIADVLAPRDVDALKQWVLYDQDAATDPKPSLNLRDWYEGILEGKPDNLNTAQRSLSTSPLQTRGGVKAAIIEFRNPMRDRGPDATNILDYGTFYHDFFSKWFK